MHAALIELYSSHDECLYSQARFLKAGGYTVHLLCNAELGSRVQDIDIVDHSLFVPFGAGNWTDFRQLLKIRRYLLDQNISVAILNTARGSRIRNLLLLPNPHTQFIGIGHIANKIFSGFTSRLIRAKVKKYFVLNEYILPQLPKDDSIQVQAMYPIFYPPYKTSSVKKPNEEFWVCIPGGIELARKDYDALLDNILRNKLDSRIKFILLGRSNLARSENQNFIETLKKHSLDRHFVWFEDYVERDEFFSYLNNCDLVLPLIHPQKPPYAEYITYKISGAFNLAFGLQIPMLCERSFEALGDFAVSSFFYEEDELAQTLNGLLDRGDELRIIRDSIRSYEKFQFDYQQERYVSFIEG